MPKTGAMALGKRSAAHGGGGAVVAEVAVDAVTDPGSALVSDAVADAVSAAAGDGRRRGVADAVADAVADPVVRLGPVLDGAEVRAIEAIGGRWKLLVLRALLVGGARGYRALLGSLAGVTTQDLTRTLLELSAAGLVGQSAGDEGVIFELTRAGRGLMPTFLSLGVWGRGFLAGGRGLESDGAVPGGGAMPVGGDRGGGFETQIPFGNDRKKSNGKNNIESDSKSKSRFPAGMTTKGAMATAKAAARTTAKAKVTKGTATGKSKTKARTRADGWAGRG